MEKKFFHFLLFEEILELKSLTVECHYQQSFELRLGLLLLGKELLGLYLVLCCYRYIQQKW